MTREEKRDIAHIIRRETGCDMMTAITAIEKVIEALKSKPLTVMDNPPQLKITWEQNDTEGCISKTLGRI